MTNWYGGPSPVAPRVSPQALSALRADMERIAGLDTRAGHPITGIVGPSAQPTGTWVECRCGHCRTHYGDTQFYGSGVHIVRCVRSECRKNGRDRTPIYYGAVLNGVP